MAWIKKEANVEVSKELEYNKSSISETNAYEAEVVEAYIQESKDEASQSQSLVIKIKTTDGEDAKTYFTVTGRDGNTYFESTVAGKKVKKQHFGLSIVNSLFKIALDKEIFDCEPTATTFQKWDNEAKEMETIEADGFPELIGSKIGVCIQMIRKIQGKNSMEYPEIVHFFDTETGLFAEEEDSGKRKLDKWLASAKDFKVIEEEAPKSAFGKKADDSEEKPTKRRWGK